MSKTKSLRMPTDDKLWNICVDIYKESFAKSTPPINFDKVLLRARAGKLKDDWFMAHYLPQDALEAIIKKHCAKHKLNPRDSRKVNIEIMLGCSPTGAKPEKSKK